MWLARSSPPAPVRYLVASDWRGCSESKQPMRRERSIEVPTKNSPKSSAWLSIAIQRQRRTASLKVSAPG